jgi:signal transduction histidine kinase
MIVQCRKAVISGPRRQVVGMVMDISKLKNLEEASQKMRDIFFSSVAHELRTPLNSIIPILSLIIENLSENMDPRILNYIKIIFNSTMHL